MMILSCVSALAGLIHPPPGPPRLPFLSLRYVFPNELSDRGIGSGRLDDLPSAPLRPSIALFF